MKKLLLVLLSAGVCLSLAFGQTPDTRAELNAMLDKAVKAMGGAEKLAKFKGVQWKGKATFEANGMQAELTHEGTFHGFAKFRLEGSAQVNGMDNSGLLVSDGDKVWISTNGRIQEIPKMQAVVFREFFGSLPYPVILASLKNKEYQLSHLGEIKVNDRPALGLHVTRKDHRDVNLFFDKDNGLPVKIETRIHDFLGQEVALEYFLSDYKEFDGLKLFSKITFKVAGQEFSTELSEIRGQEKLDDSLFAKP
jgi:outer membrane lipoprotein-sorting protein